jgi:hypothetical protein
VLASFQVIGNHNGLDIVPTFYPEFHSNYDFPCSTEASFYMLFQTDYQLLKYDHLTLSFSSNIDEIYWLQLHQFIVINLEKLNVFGYGKLICITEFATSKWRPAIMSVAKKPPEYPGLTCSFFYE